MSNFIWIVGEYKLDKLRVMFEDIDSNDRFVVLFICAENTIEVLSFFVLEQLKTEADEFKESF